MKTSTVLALVAATAAAFTTGASAQDGAFTNEDKALWIDHHNYFRMAALPWSAANMLKMKWSDDLATAAINEAKTCAAVTAAGINVHTHAATDTKSVVNSAFQEWAVVAALKVLPTLTAPKDGEAVGTGMYNSYSQIVWSSTNQVGCGYATCGTGKSVVCKYAPAGNGPNEPWFIHNTPNSQCPAGTQGDGGLCIVPGDAGNNDIAPIPAGAHAYETFATFMSNELKALKGEVVNVGSGSSAADGGPMTGTSESTNPNAANATTTNEENVPAKSVSFGSLTDGSDGTPGVVRPSSGSGSTFFNEVTTPETAVGGAGASTAATSADEAVAAASPSKKGSEESGTVTGANNKSSEEDSEGGGITPAGWAGVIVVGCVMVAGIAVFTSYRKNQRRQREIMQNGGIHIL
uniref:SCP domain-containing protein n=1 Tax=Globisporangium ultimum (strain ATCC 200006 / CBS 805.95 / DAOM BR144) TaxID=431595 RepID=K3WFS4_GLOUD